MWEQVTPQLDRAKPGHRAIALWLLVNFWVETGAVAALQCQLAGMGSHLLLGERVGRCRDDLFSKKGCSDMSWKVFPARQPSTGRRKEPGYTQIIAPISFCPIKSKAHMWNFTADLTLILYHAKVTWGFYRGFVLFKFCLWLLGVSFLLGCLGVL